jgi:hypothetical protein
MEPVSNRHELPTRADPAVLWPARDDVASRQHVDFWLRSDPLIAQHYLSKMSEWVSDFKTIYQPVGSSVSGCISSSERR